MQKIHGGEQMFPKVRAKLMKATEQDAAVQYDLHDGRNPQDFLMRLLVMISVV